MNFKKTLNRIFISKTPTANGVHNDIIKYVRWGVYLTLAAWGFESLIKGNIVMPDFDILEVLILGVLGIYYGYESTKKHFPNGVPQEYTEEQKQFIKDFFGVFKSQFLGEDFQLGEAYHRLGVHEFDFQFKDNEMEVTIYLSKPGLLIGISGNTIDKLNAALAAKIPIYVKVLIEEYHPLDTKNYFD